ATAPGASSAGSTRSKRTSAPLSSGLLEAASERGQAGPELVELQPAKELDKARRVGQAGQAGVVLQECQPRITRHERAIERVEREFHLTQCGMHGRQRR